MNQGVGPLDRSLGYVIKQTDAVLRQRMDAVLRPLDLTVAQFACLTLLAQHRALSNADLARGAFVSRQAMNLVLRGLQDRELVTRPPVAERGRERPAELTDQGSELQRVAGERVAEVERDLFAPLASGDQRSVIDALHRCLHRADDQRA